MLKLAEQNVTVCWVPLEFVEGRAEDLSALADHSFDRVMANYLFHYIEDPELVCGEMKRLLAPGGRAIVTIESRSSMPEMYRLHFAAMEKVGFPADFIARLPRGRRGKMALEDAGKVLRSTFEHVDNDPTSMPCDSTGPSPI